MNKNKLFDSFVRKIVVNVDREHYNINLSLAVLLFSFISPVVVYCALDLGTSIPFYGPLRYFEFFIFMFVISGLFGPFCVLYFYFLSRVVFKNKNIFPFCIKRECEVLYFDHCIPIRNPPFSRSFPIRVIWKGSQMNNKPDEIKMKCNICDKSFILKKMSEKQYYYIED